MNHQKILLQIIEEEIESFLLEQAAPPAAPVAPPAPEAPATPDAPAGDAAEEEGSEESDTAKKIKALASKTPTDIKKILLSDLQNGGKREEAEAVVAYVNKKEEEPEGASDSDEERVPPNVIKAVDHIQKTFKFKVPEKAKEKVEKEEEPASAEQPPASPAAPVTESRLQTTLREYLHYKRLYNKNKKSGSV